MVPPAEAVAVTVNTSIEKYASIEWLAVTLLKSWLATAPRLTPSTTTLSMW